MADHACFYGCNHESHNLRANPTMSERDEAIRRLRAQAANGRASAHVFVKDLDLVLGEPVPAGTEAPEDIYPGLATKHTMDWVASDTGRLVGELRRRANLPADVPEKAFLVGIRHLLKSAADAIDAPQEERDPVDEIKEARGALSLYESKMAHKILAGATETRLYSALKALVELVDGAQLPAYDKRDMAKAFREGAYSMNERWRATEPDWPHNHYTDTGEFK